MSKQFNVENRDDENRIASSELEKENFIEMIGTGIAICKLIFIFTPESYVGYTADVTCEKSEGRNDVTVSICAQVADHQSNRRKQNIGQKLPCSVQRGYYYKQISFSREFRELNDKK